MCSYINIYSKWIYFIREDHYHLSFVRFIAQEVRLYCQKKYLQHWRQSTNLDQASSAIFFSSAFLFSSAILFSSPFCSAILFASAHLFSSATLFSAFKTLSFSVMFLMASSSAILRCLFHWFRPLFLGQSPLILFFFSCRVGCQYRFSQRIKVVKPAEESLSHSSNINHLVQIILLPALVPREISATRSISAQTPHRWLRTVVLLWLVDWGGLSWQHQVQFPGTRWLGMKWSRTS